MATLNIKGFPDALHAALKELAKRERRSLSRQVVHLLRHAVERREPLSLLGLKGLGKHVWTGVDAAKHVDGERAGWD